MFLLRYGMSQADSAFASQVTLLNTFYSLTHFTPHHTLLLSTPWDTLLPGTLCFKCSREQRMLRRTIYKLAKCSREQNVLSKMCWEAKCPQEAKCSREQSVHQPPSSQLLRSTRNLFFSTIRVRSEAIFFYYGKSTYGKRNPISIQFKAFM